MAIELVSHELQKAKEFYNRLKPKDAITVKALVETISLLSDQFLKDSDQENVFFGVYGIAGNVTKFGDRPDIDLLVVTNAVWGNGYSSEDNRLNGDWVAGTIHDTFSKEGYKVKPIEKIPNEYSMVGAPHKGMIRLESEDSERKPIDVVIVNHSSLRLLRPKNNGRYIQTLSEFEEKVDVDKYGNLLPRVLLFKA